jgi:hypothetical protein
MSPDGCSPVSDETAFRRRFTFPEEERRRLTSAPWIGGFRWFRSHNVVDLESYRRQKRTTGRPPANDQSPPRGN